MKRKLSIICVLCLFIFTFSGCSVVQKFTKNDDAEGAVKGFLDAVKKDDTSSAKSFLVNPDDYESLTDIAKNVGLENKKVEKFVDEFTTIKYTIESSKKGDDANKAVVIVTMTIPDYSPSFTQALGKIDANSDKETALKTIMETLADSSPSAVQKAVAVNVVKTNDKWLIDYSNNNIELLNAVNGNLLSSLQSFLRV